MIESSADDVCTFSVKVDAIVDENISVESTKLVIGKESKEWYSALYVAVGGVNETVNILTEALMKDEE